MLQTVQDNIQKLISAYEKEKGRRVALESKSSILQDRLKEAEKKITELEDKVDKLSLRGVFSPAGSDKADNAQAIAKIDKLLGQIDACLEKLG